MSRERGGGGVSRERGGGVSCERGGGGRDLEEEEALTAAEMDGVQPLPAGIYTTLSYTEI